LVTEATRQGANTNDEKFDRNRVDMAERNGIATFHRNLRRNLGDSLADVTPMASQK
jgi:hypothetical protein